MRGIVGSFFFYVTVAGAHSVTPTQFNLQVGGPTGTVTVANSGSEIDCTTTVTWRIAGTNPSAITVAPGPNPGAVVSPTKVDYTTPPVGSATLVITPVQAGQATLMVTWAITSTSPSCNGSFTQSIFVTVTAPPAPPPPARFTCEASAPYAPTVRAEGTAELLGDLLLTCNGGTPPAAGAQVFTASLQVYLNTQITNRFIGEFFSEAFLLIDDPSPNNQALCAPGTSCPVTGTGGGLNFAVPSAPGNGGQPVKNVYQGLISSNSVTFLGVPISPPQQGMNRVFRVTNIRANASALTPGTTSTPIQASVAISGSTSIPVMNPQVVLGTVQPGLNFTIHGAQSYQQCVPPPATDGPPIALRYTEYFPTVFKRMREASGNTGQAVPGHIYNTESGYFNSTLFPGPQTTPTPGQADAGTRLIAMFSGVPSGVQLFASVDSIPGPTSATARMTASEHGEFRPVAPSTTRPGGLFEISLVGGAGQAVWEVIDSDPTRIDRLEFPIYAVPSHMAGNLPTLGTATVEGSFAPIAVPAPTTATPPTPRFAKTGKRHAAFSIDVCRTNLLFPFVTTQTGFDTGLQISNMSRDPLNPADVTTPNVTTFPILNQNRVDNFTLNVTASNNRQPAGNQATANWLTVDVNQTSTPATATLTANPAGLAAGTYNGSINIASPQASSPLQIPVRYTILPVGPSFGAYGVVNAASYFPAAVAPGEAVVVFGRRFGPPNLAALMLDGSGLVATTLGETRVFFDDIPAPMIYAANGQISAFVPFATGDKKSTVMRIEYRGAPSLEVTLPVVDAVPGLFTANASGSGQGAVLNLDYSANSLANPTTEDGIVMLFGTGAGKTNPPGRDGRRASVPLPELALPVKAFIGGIEAEVLYAGPAPGLVEGVLQVNVRVPKGIAKGAVPVWITAGDKRSQSGVTVAVR